MFNLKSSLYPLICGFFVIVFVVIVGIWSNAYIPPMGGVGGKWRESRITNVKSYLYNMGQTWDTKHYVHIAEHSYSIDEPSYFAFFPLFPLEIRTVHKVSNLSYQASSILAGSLNFIFLCVVLYVFVNSYYRDNFEYLVEPEHTSININSVFIFLFFTPFTVFFYFAYTESIFLAMLLSIFWIVFYSQNKWWLLVLPILCYLLALTRVIGIVIAPALVLYLMLKAFKPNWIKENMRIVSLIFISICTNIMGILTFMYYGFIKTNNYLISRDAQIYWGRGFTANIFKPIITSYHNLFDVSATSGCTVYLDCRYGIVYELLGCLLAFIAIVVSVVFTIKHRDNREATVRNCVLIFFSVVAWVIPLMSNSTGSFGRYLITAPIYSVTLWCVLVHKVPRTYLSLVFAVFVLIQAIFVVLFSTHYWIG